MKLTTIIISTLFVGTSLFLSSTKACEQPCRDGVSAAFSEKYKLELEPLFDAFKTDIVSNALTGVDMTKFSATIGTDVTNAISLTADTVRAKFFSSLSSFAMDAIFSQQPKFMGDCNHPKRVTQPPAGVAWKPSDCVAMDYICGNPPSICHHLDIVKARVIGTINFGLAFNATGSGPYIKAFTQAAADAATAGGASTSDVNTFLIPTVGVNIANSLLKLVQSVATGFCVGTSCNKYDAEISTLLLSYP
ncbi:7142_t:CDS:1 [Paraglomus brasilianum]|uniref:7142_t:CDS:1 n=1 Tax=Paraglomus brasilianum TaxID=144538 RepID=A0A9N9C6U2_9GLOM|nr:7142_t:CDS:1 [Paraglomus brasilianum]